MTTPKSKHLLTPPQLEELIEKAKNAEACRDIDTVRKILNPVWNDIHESPNFNSYEKPIRAELLRLAGFFLAFYGYSKSKKDFLERGRDLLTNAIELFEVLGCPHKLTQAKIFLALCYWYEGAAEESEAILDNAELLYKGNKQHDVYLQICYYRLITFIQKRNYAEASRIIEEMKPLIEKCENTRILALYHTEAGVDCRRQKKYDEAKRHYMKALEYAGDMDICGLVTANLNNLAFLNKDTGHFDRAHRYIDEAIAITKKLGQTGFLAHKYDTKALIYFDVRDYENALLEINKAIDLFLQGEDYFGLSDAMFDKAKILLRLGQVGKGLSQFAELLETARIRLGEAAAKRYVDDFAKLIYAKRGVAYREEVRLFQKDLVRNALIDSDKVMTKTKDLLSISQQGFSEILNKQFPELCEEVGIERSGSQRKINPVLIENPVVKGIDPVRLVTFEVHKEKLPQLETKKDIVVAVLKGPNQILKDGKFFLVQCNVRNVLECGRLCKETALDFFYFENDSDPCPFTPKDITVVGEIVGYCYVDEINRKLTEFRPIA